MTIVALLLTFILALQDPLGDRIRALLDLLRSDDIESREKATQDFIALGVDALPRLEKAHTTSEGDVRARLGIVIDRLRREAKLIKLAPPVRLVTVSAKDRPLKDFLDDVGRQAGAPCEFDPAVANLTVTIEAKGDPLLKVLDRACHARADLTFEIAKGKLRMIHGKHPDVPTAYTGPYRARLMKTAACKADVVALYFRLDAQPDQPYLSVTGTGTSAQAGLTIRSASQVPMTNWLWTSMEGLTITLDDVPVPLARPEDLGGIFLVKPGNGEARSLGTVRFGALFHYSLGSSTAETPMTGKPRWLTVGNYFLIFRGPRMIVQRDESMPRPLRSHLDELADLDSFSVTDTGGKRIRMVSQGRKSDFTSGYRFEFVAEKELKDPVLKVQYDVYDLAARGVEFELKDIKLRD